MKMKEVMEIIEGCKGGFMVSLEWKKGSILSSDHFPDKHGGEDLIPTEKEAWLLADEFAKKTVGKAVNIYVMNSDFTPVKGYRKKHIENR